MQKQNLSIPVCMCLLIAGYVFVHTQSPVSANSVQGAASASDFVVVAGYESGQSPSQSKYYVVSRDGSARAVSIGTRSLYAPTQTKMDIDVDLPSRIRVDHSGQIRQ